MMESKLKWIYDPTPLEIFIISGYSFHQGSFLHITSSGDVVLDGTVTQDSVQKGQHHMSAEAHNAATPPQVQQRQGIREMCRDVLGKDSIMCIKKKQRVYRWIHVSKT
jgi:hypothetical protein